MSSNSHESHGGGIFNSSIIRALLTQAGEVISKYSRLGAAQDEGTQVSPIVGDTFVAPELFASASTAPAALPTGTSTPGTSPSATEGTEVAGEADLWDDVQSFAAAAMATEPTAPVALEPLAVAPEMAAMAVPSAAVGATGSGYGGTGNPNAGSGQGAGQGSGQGYSGAGNPNAGSGQGVGQGGGQGNDGLGNPNAGSGQGVGQGGGQGNGGQGNDDSPGDGSGDGNQGDGGGGGGNTSSAPTPPDVLLQDREGAFTSTYTFSIDDITGDFGGGTVATNPNIIDWDSSKITKAGVELHAIDSEFGFYVTDFLGAEQKVYDGAYTEGWAGNLHGEDGEQAGLVVSNAPTITFATPARLGTWLAGIGGNTVKASTEHYSVMQSVLSDQAYPEDGSALYQLDDDLRIIDYKTNADGTADLGADGKLQVDVMHDYYVDELLQAMEDAAGYDETTSVPMFKDFDRDGVDDEYTAYMSDIEIDGMVRNVAAVDIGNDGVIDYYDGELNGFGTFGLADILIPNESTVIADIAYGDDYSVTLKDDGKLLYRWGNAVKRPNDIRIDAKMDLPDEWSPDDIGDSVIPLFHITAAELIVHHTVTNNPNDQIRPEDFENEAAIGQLPSYIEVRDPSDPDNVLWVAPADMYAGDGTYLPSFFKLTDTGEIDMTAGGIEVRDATLNTLIGYQNEDANGDAIGTVLRDFSLIEAAAGTTLDEIGAASGDLKDGFTLAWYTTMDREPFQADLNEDGTEYDIGPRWRLQPDKYGQDLPSVTIPQDPSEPGPVSHGEEKYEVGADTTTVLNLLDWNGVSPLTLSAGWMSGSGTVSDNGLNMTDAFDVAYYVKGDVKPATLYDAELVLSYEEVALTAAGENAEGTGAADVLAGLGNNTFFLGDTDGETDIVVLSYGSDITTANVWDNYVDGFKVDEDALGLIGFELNPDNYNIHLTQEVTADDDLLVSYDGTQIATLYDVTDYLDVDDFYFA